MISPAPAARTQCRLRFAIVAVVLTFFYATSNAQAQGLIQGVQQGAQAGNKAAGPVGGVLGGAIGGVVGVFTGALGAGSSPPAQQPANAAKPGPAKQAKSAKAAKAAKPTVLTQDGAPQLTAEQMVSNIDPKFERIKVDLKLTPERKKNWTAFNSAMHYLG